MGYVDKYVNIELEDLEYRGIITIKLSIEEFGKLLLGESTNCEYIKYWKKMKLYAVRCFANGYGECGNECHIVGIFSIEEKAKEAKKLHNKYRHLYNFYIGIDEIEMDTYIKSYDEGEKHRLKEE